MNGDMLTISDLEDRPTIRVLTEHIRKCGFRKPGGFYIVSELDNEEGVLAPFTLINPPKPTHFPQTRAYIIVDGDAILGDKSEEYWLDGASRDRQDRNSWYIETFGMPFERRKKMGVCAGLKTEEACIEKLISKITPNFRISSLVREMGNLGINDLCPSSYASFVKAAQRIVGKRGDTSDALKLVASLHRMPYEAGYRRNQVKSFVMRGLTLMNLMEDAVSIAKGE